MKLFVTLSALLMLYSIASAQESFITLNQDKYQQGDTLKFNCSLPQYKTAGIRYATMYLLIEDMGNQKRWTYRYPVMDGSCNAAIIIDSSMRNGKYAFSFLMRKSFFSMACSLESGEQMEVSYAMLTKNDDTRFDNVKADQNGNFSLKGLLYQDTAYFVFTPTGKAKQAGLKMDIITPLDSIFVSDATFTQIISLGNTTPVTETDKMYHAEINAFIGKTTLPDVVVSTSRKKKVELFNEQYSSGLFNANINARIFDGLEDTRIARSATILDFLRSAVAGLRVIQSRGTYILQWRGISSFQSSTASNVDVFVDEFQLSEITDSFINPGDVAMVKAFPPPAFLSPGGQKGAIAIYTKRGGFENDNLYRNKFKVFGYSSPDEIWK